MYVAAPRLDVNDIMAVIGRHHGNAQLFFNANEVGMDAMLFRQALVLDFHEEIIFAKDLAVEAGRATRRVILPCQQVLADFTRPGSRSVR